MTDFSQATLDVQQRNNLLAELSAYADTDLLCYFADEPRLYAQQVRQWEPILRAVESELQLRITRTKGVMPVVQPIELKQYCEKMLGAYDDAGLVAMAQLITRLGSVIMAIALVKESVTLDQALEAASLDEGYQTDEWGADDAISARLDRRAEYVREAWTWLQR